jgi:hypothetical protein
VAASRRTQPQPHHGVFVRLAPSRTHGVGVFAIRRIRRGAAIFPDDKEPTTSVPRMLPRKLPRALRQLYEDFCVLRSGRYLCPSNFNRLTPSWYLNHSDDPNVRCDKSLQFFALRSIRAGEELTVDYRTYSADPLPWMRRASPPRKGTSSNTPEKKLTKRGGSRLS